MHVVNEFNKNNEYISQFCLGKKIISFQCDCNRPIEKDCVTIILMDNTEIRIYSFMRIIQNNKSVFSITDYWLNNDILHIIKDIEKILSGSRITETTFNDVGDCVLCLENGVQVQIFIDVTMGETDYLRIDNNKKYYVLCRIDNKLTEIVGND